ncbi:Pif1-like DNA helicase [Erwinia phage Hena1]|uniref:Pif1-like DNA helicase n=1 Tax=Erwinia phage Hena1 TaxID=2678601 RepID=A0A6B9JBD5_9CAUD|nr:helicase [Erwinia phage Hena1]QGZ16356.1 Pif1-like DNA helicase [Erwinia phage Hena1]
MSNAFGVGTDDAIKAVMGGGNVFVTGPGGTGKTHTIKKIQALFPDTTLTVAPTGVAALNVEGMTAHRAFGLSMGVSSDEDVMNIKRRHEKLMKSKDLERIIIDEISMIRADKLWEIDQKLRLVRKKPNEPFGGIQVIKFGDFFQNLPVLTSTEEDLYRSHFNTELCCWSDTWRDAQPYPVMLEKMYRQQSDNFARMLNCLRKGERLDDVVDYINDNCYKPLDNPQAITLTSTNAQTERINKKFFDDIQSPVKIYKSKVEGDFKSKPGPDELALKVGLKVMITANQISKPHEDPAYVNGSIGFIRKMFATYVVVELLDGTVVDVMENVWENVEYTPEKVIDPISGKQKSKISKKVIGQFLALPLRAAYAVTIHKAQGLTLPAVNIDFGYGTFSAGMAYVALSRATHTGGLRMVKPLKKRDIMVDPRVITFYNQTFPGK